MEKNDDRADSRLIPEDPLVLENLKALQDASSPEKALLPCQQDNVAHTFNNSLVAMAFLLKGECERAERILDFFAAAMDKNNEDPDLQNFYYKGEPRGFFQNVLLCGEGSIAAYHTSGFTDRWMGDLAWLALAYGAYERRHGFESKPAYRTVRDALVSLLESFYIKSPEGCYVRHGWRWGPFAVRMDIERALRLGLSASDVVARCKEGSGNGNAELDALIRRARNDDHLHEALPGHPEGNIDCWAVFRALGKDDLCAGIKPWLDGEIGRMEADGWRMPLDLVSWRALAFGGDFPEIRKNLYVIEADGRYRKTVEVRGKAVTGFFHGAEPDINNIWADGTGHMACAFYAAGDEGRGNFYANQMDCLIIENTVAGKKTHAIPFTANRTGGYGWVNQEKGFVSAAAWYIFAKNKYNPLNL